MKLSPLLIAASLAANAALAIVLFNRFSRPTSSDSSGAPVRSASVQTPAAARTFDPQTWTRLNATAPTDFVARLRAEGFPPEIIRAMTREFVREQFRARYQALAEAEANKPYWTRNGPFSTDPKLSAERRALGREVDALMLQLLGAEALQPTPDQLTTLEQRYGKLPAGKLSQIQKITADYNDLSKEITELADGVLLPGDRARLALIQKERDADIAKLLSPEELMEHELHHSSTANRLLAQLSAFDATEEEFRALFAINRAIDVQYGNPGVLSPEERRARQAAQKNLVSQIETALGPERYAAYQQAIDPNYKQALELVTRLELPKANAVQVVAVQKDVEQRIAAIRSNPALSSEDRQAQFVALHQEAAEKLTVSLRARGLDAYKSSGGFWLQNLQQLTTRSAPKSAPKVP